jgi:hypothetical protein
VRDFDWPHVADLPAWGAHVRFSQVQTRVAGQVAATAGADLGYRLILCERLFGQWFEAALDNLVLKRAVIGAHACPDSW